MGGGIITFEDFPVDFLGIFIINLLVFGYDYLDLFDGRVCCNFLGFVFRRFCHLS